MLPVYDITTTTDFIHPDDKDEPKTIFSIGIIDAKAQAYIDNSFTQLAWVRSSETDAKTGKPVMQPSVTIDRANKQIELVRMGVKGVRNFHGELKFVEETYPFGVRRVLDEKSINILKPYIAELARAIENNSVVTADDEKK